VLPSETKASTLSLINQMLNTFTPFPLLLLLPLRLQADGADYVGVGAVFPTGTKASSVIGLAGVSEVCRSASLPAVAIGGVGAHNAQETIAAGAEGLAVVSAVFSAPDVEVATRELRQAVDRALELHAAQQQQQQTEEPVVAVVA
jgi:thiazole synthase ThiGH ThiG subunit